MRVPEKKNKQILAIPLAFVMVIVTSTVAITAEARYAWGTSEDTEKPKGTIQGNAGTSHQDVERPVNPRPLSEVEYMVVISSGAANKTATHPLVPDPITVKSGGNITVVNQDDVEHTAVQGTPETGQKGFDSGIIGAGKNATITVKGQPHESIPYYCRIHPWLMGTINIAAENSSNSSAGSAPAAIGNQTGQQQQQQTPQAPGGSPGNNSNSSSSHLTTFTVGGTIASWAAGSNNTGNVISPELLSGRWSLQVVNGTAKSFDANITMVNSNGSGFHTHTLSNFKVSDESLSTTLIHNQTGSKVAAPLELASPNSSLSIPGRIDISADGNKTWPDAPVNVMINHLRSLYIATDEGITGNHFTEGQFAPGIYGIVDSVKDSGGHELFQNGKVSLPGS